MNGDKAEIIWFGSRANLKKLSSVDTTLRIGSTIVEQVNLMLNLVVYMDSALSIRTHIGKSPRRALIICVVSASYVTLCSKSTMQRLVSALVLARIDYLL